MPIKNRVVKIVKEDGIVLYRQFKPAMDEWTDNTGRKVAAQPDRYIVGVISSSAFDPVEGYALRTLEEYKVERAEFAKFTYGAAVEVTFELASWGVKTHSVSLKPIAA